MKKIYEQYSIGERDGSKTMLGTFWINSDTGEVDEDNLPTKKELLEIFRSMVNYDIVASSTGNTIREDE